MTEFLGYVATQTLEGRSGDDGALMDAWRRGNDHVLALAETEAGYADGIELGDMPEELAPLVARALADPVMRRDYALAPVSIEWIELDRLVVQQKHINLAFADELRAEIGETPSVARIFEFALPYDKRRDPPIQTGQIGEAAWIFKSVSNDFRILDAELLEPEQVTGFDGVRRAVRDRRAQPRLRLELPQRALGREPSRAPERQPPRLRAARSRADARALPRPAHLTHEELRAIVGDGHPLMAQGENVLTAEPAAALQGLLRRAVADDRQRAGVCPPGSGRLQPERDGSARVARACPPGLPSDWRSSVRSPVGGFACRRTAEGSSQKCGAQLKLQEGKCRASSRFRAPKRRPQRS